MSDFIIGFRAVHQIDLNSAIIECVENGFSVLEVHFSAPQFFPSNYSPAEIMGARKFAEEKGVILQTHSEIGQSLVFAETGLRKAEKAKLKRQMEFSKKLGARSFTIHIGKAPQYHLGPGKELRNEHLYTDFYTRLFEDSLKYIVSIAPKDLYICIENDHLLPIYQPILQKYLKTGKVFLTWDIMKSFSFKQEIKIKPDQWKFLKRNLEYVKNIHVSGPSHGSLGGYEKEYSKFFKLLAGKNLPMIIEIISLKDAIKAKNIFIF